MPSQLETSPANPERSIRTPLLRLIPLVCALVLVALITSASAAPNQNRLAERVARAWADTSVSHVADQLGRAATLNVPVLRTVAGQIVEDKIQDSLIWSFSAPRKVSDSVHLYEVTVTAGVPFAVDVLNRRLGFTIFADFILQIDTQQQKVTSSHLDPGSFHFQQTQQ